MVLLVRTITAAEHRAYLASHPRVPLEQTPGWGRVFENARTESVGWFEGETLLGAGLVRYRGLPRLPMRSVAVFESGPDIDWTGRRRSQYSLQDWTDPLADYLRDRGAFTVRVSPVVVEREWWGVDPAERSASKALVKRQDEPKRWEHREAERRLSSAGWSRLTNAPTPFGAEVVVAAGVTHRRLQEFSQDNSLMTGFTVRTGERSELTDVHRAVSRRHKGLSLPGAAAWSQRWDGLGSDNPAAVKLLVVEQRGAIVYGGLVAVSGERAWDLSVPLPLPDAELPEVQILRAHVLAHTSMRGCRALAVPTVTRQRHEPVRHPAPGWPPVHLTQLLGTWQLPVRATWHAALSPIVDHVML
jgi:hypothetical protein